MSTPTFTPNAALDQLQAIDALHRFAHGMDTKDAAMLASAFALDAKVDFSPAAYKLGMQFPAMVGREVITSGLIGFVKPMDTSHSVANPRVSITGERAELLALVEAQHLPAQDHSRHMLMKNRYRVSLVRSGNAWLISEMTIDNIWADGDIGVVTGS
jgi:hypothetical protein